MVTDEVMLFMALTFGTLLSSQGADAHHREPFGSLWGNLCYHTRSVSQCQTDLLDPGQPMKLYSVRFAVSNDLLVPRPASLAFAVAKCYLAGCPAGSLRGSVRRAVRTLAQPHAQVKSWVPEACRPRIFGTTAT